MSVMAGLRVLETASWVAGQYCGKLLADHGGDVLKVEPPEGDPTRRAGPFPGETPDPERSGLFLHLNAGKRSCVIDSTCDTDLEALRRMAASADAVIDDGLLAAAGIDYESLRSQNPALVLVSLSGFGDDGPYRDFRANDFAIYAASGWIAAMGRPDEPPVYPGRDYPFYIAALYAAFGTTIALYHARRSGRGQRVGVSALDAAISVDFYETTSHSFGVPLRQRHGSRISGVASSLQPCRDGWIALTVNVNSAWDAFCDVIGAPELATGPFATPQLRLANADALEARVREKLSTLAVADVVEACQARHVAVAPVATVADLLDSRQLRARDWWQRVAHPMAGPLQHPGPPFRLQKARWRIPGPAPLLGQDQDSLVTNGWSR
jgi:crotonobetainyl-CoA:carnitine CoA-transferase CaiB-like acyl-CoA transferase